MPDETRDIICDIPNASWKEYRVELNDLQGIFTALESIRSKQAAGTNIATLKNTTFSSPYDNTSLHIAEDESSVGEDLDKPYNLIVHYLNILKTSPFLKNILSTQRIDSIKELIPEADALITHEQIDNVNQLLKELRDAQSSFASNFAYVSPPRCTNYSPCFTSPSPSLPPTYSSGFYSAGFQSSPFVCFLIFNGCFSVVCDSGVIKAEPKGGLINGKCNHNDAYPEDNNIFKPVVYGCESNIGIR